MTSKQSVIIVVPGRIYCLINGINVSAVRSLTGIKNTPLSSYLYPQTPTLHQLSSPYDTFVFRILIHLLLPPLLWPPIGDDSLSKIFPHTWRQKLNQSTTVLQVAMLHSLMTSFSVHS